MSYPDIARVYKFSKVLVICIWHFDKSLGAKSLQYFYFILLMLDHNMLGMYLPSVSSRRRSFFAYLTLQLAWIVQGRPDLYVGYISMPMSIHPKPTRLEIQ